MEGVDCSDSTTSAQNLLTALSMSESFAAKLFASSINSTKDNSQKSSKDIEANPSFLLDKDPNEFYSVTPTSSSTDTMTDFVFPMNFS